MTVDYGERGELLTEARESDPLFPSKFSFGALLATRSPLESELDILAGIDALIVQEPTSTPRFLRAQVLDRMVLTSWVEDFLEEPTPSNSEMLVSALDDLLAWLPLSQERVAQIVGISTSTVMAWRREPHVRPRHRNAPTLIRLWAAVASAREELGDERTLRLLAEGPRSVIGSREVVPVEEIIERLNVAAEEAAAAALDEAWQSEGDWEDPAAEDIAAGEMTLGEDDEGRESDRT